jgi:glycosidase
MNDFDDTVLKHVHNLGITHVWFTGVIRHSSCTDYSSFGIPTQHPAVVKGKAGSPYAICDYYDIDPDISDDVKNRMQEFEALVSRTHQHGMKVIIDFVPNHVARQYHSIAKPEGVKDLGTDDDCGKPFDANNNFYYCTGEEFAPSIDLFNGSSEPYREFPAKATGNDRFDNHPGVNDWYETVKLNYGIDYTDPHGRSSHFIPIPDTWVKMTDILLFWASKGVDGFRCDMAEMVPPDFWNYAANIVKKQYKGIIFIGEVYDPNLYHTYIKNGFDYLYDKVGMYDCLRDVICGKRSAATITNQWQANDDIHEHMLYFLENHDEQRIASDFFCGNADKALPAIAVAALMRSNPFMIYAGEEYGERGMDVEGFSKCDGRTSIFDYWTVSSIYKGYFDPSLLSNEEKHLAIKYQQILRIANREKAVREGDFFDLMYVNPQSSHFNPLYEFTYIRKSGDDVILVVANFSDESFSNSINIPEHAFDVLNMVSKDVEAVDLLTGETVNETISPDVTFKADVMPWSARVYKFNMSMNDVSYVLNAHDKDEFPPAHTAEHLLNQLMCRMFGCKRSSNAHIERKKSKISYVIDHKNE